MRKHKTFITFTRTYEGLDGRLLSVRRDPEGNVTIEGTGCFIRLRPEEWDRLVDDMETIRTLSKDILQP